MYQESAIVVVVLNIKMIVKAKTQKLKMEIV
jgi:hypothetical protein